MDTVQLQCGHCGQLMAVSLANLGLQVHCPHCRQVVQVPHSLDEAEPATEEHTASQAEENLPKLRIASTDDESILEERGQAGDLFGRQAKPRLELPPLDPPAPRPPAPSPPASSMRAHPADVGTGIVADEELPLPMLLRRRPDNSILVPILLMFLIPYAIATTAFIAFLLYAQSKRINPLEVLPDPKPGDGGPRQIQHDLDVTLKTQLQQALRIGDLEVTPLKVEKSALGNLTLHLKCVNVSTNIEFNPIHDSFVNFNASRAVARPYTFVEPQGKNPSDRLYGGFLRWSVMHSGREKPVDHTHRLAPGKEMLIELSTRDDPEERKRARKLADNPQDVLWRVQVRRGFLSTSKGPRSATAVIGVEFHTSEIAKEGV